MLQLHLRTIGSTRNSMTRGVVSETNPNKIHKYNQLKQRRNTLVKIWRKSKNHERVVLFIMRNCCCIETNRILSQKKHLFLLHHLCCAFIHSTFKNRGQVFCYFLHCNEIGFGNRRNLIPPFVFILVYFILFCFFHRNIR